MKKTIIGVAIMCVGLLMASCSTTTHSSSVADTINKGGDAVVSVAHDVMGNIEGNQTIGE